MENGFSKAELRGRKLFEDWSKKRYPTERFDVQYQFTSDEYAHNDVFMQVTDKLSHKLTEYCVEIKTRTKKYFDMMIEQRKYFNLFKIANEQDLQVIYLNIIEENNKIECLDFNLSKIGEVKNWIFMHNTPRKTMCDGGNEDKYIYNIPTNQSDTNIFL